MSQFLFDSLSEEYDQTVQECDRLNLFPFAGYEHVLDTIASRIVVRKDQPCAKILDLGIGTARLYEKLNPDTFRLWGVDFSEKMLEHARLKFPQSKMTHHDFTLGVPEALRHERYDFIVSTYAMHHLDMQKWIGMINHLLTFLEPFGTILIGDIMFPTEMDKNLCHEAHHDYWDETEHYHVFDEIIELLDGHLALSFLKTSFCSGVMIIENVHDNALQIDDSLLKYKATTLKWKSNRTREKSE
jgi:putative AdoMet-dependent methyltransferase